MPVVILAGGLGTRLRPLTRTVPKPMVPVAGMPLLERQVRYLAWQGFDRFVLLTGYLGEQVRAHFGDGDPLGVQIEYSHEDEPLGTGGAVRQALARLGDRFLLLYGDSFLPEDYAAIARRFLEAECSGLMVVYRDAEGGTAVAPNVAVAKDGRVTRYAKGVPDEDLRFVEAGVVALRAAAVESLPLGRPASLEKEVYPALAEEGRMEAWVTQRRFYDIGTPDGMRRAERYFVEGEAAGGEDDERHS